MSIFPNYRITDHETDVISLSYPLLEYIPPVQSGSAVDPRCYPWEAEVVDESESDESESDVPDYKLYMGVGSVNGVVAAAWDEPIDIETDKLSFIILDVSLSDGAVSSITYEAVTTLPTGEDLQPVSKDTPPTSVKIILGTVMNTDICIIHNYNIVLRSRLVYQELKDGTNIGQENYTYYYTLDPVSASYDAIVTI